MKQILKFVFILFIVCGTVGGTLGLVNAVTKERITEYANIAKLEALREVFPKAEEFKEIESGKAWDALKDGSSIGSVHLIKTQGYSGPIEVIFGIQTNGIITGVCVLVQTETAGLGAKITTDKFLMQFVGKTLTEIALKKDDPENGQIDAIASATISSRAVTKAIKNYETN